MPNLIDSDLRDPSPPAPGDAERAAVAARAHQLGRTRRIMQGAGALGMVAAVAVGVAALTAGGTSGSATAHIEAAATTEAVVTTTPGAVVPTFRVSGTVGNIPDDVTVTLTLSGDAGTFSAVADGAGTYSIGGVPAGDYQAMFEAEDTTGTAASVVRQDVTISEDTNISFALQ